jgi:hypothetical protein
VGRHRRENITDPGAEGITIRVLMGDNVGAPTFTMRHFEIAPDEEHNFANAGDEPFAFLCVIPTTNSCLGR